MSALPAPARPRASEAAPPSGRPRALRGAALVGRVLVAVVLLAGGPLAAQPTALAEGPSGRLLITRRFGERDGLPRVLVYGAVRDTAGHLWLATLGGPYRLAGRRFVHEPLPPPYDALPVRQLLPVDGTLWAASTRGVFRREAAGAWQRIAASRDERIWRLAAWRPGRGEGRQVVVARDEGLDAFDAATGRRTPLRTAGFPASFGMLDVTRAGGDDVLWVATLYEGVWQLRAGAARPAWVLRPGAAGTAFEDVRACPAYGEGAVVAATDSGAWLVAPDGAVRRLGPPRNVVRAVCAGTPAAPEIWIAVRSGAIVRRVGDRETPAQFSPEISRFWLQALDALRDRDGRWSVYFGPAQGSGVWRLRTREIVAVDVPPRLRALPVLAAIEAPAGPGARPHLFASIEGVGLVDVHRPDDPRTRWPTHHGAFFRLRDSSVVAIGGGAMVRFHEGRWRLVEATVTRRVWNATAAFRRGRQSLFVSLDDGVHELVLDEGRLVPVAPFVGARMDRLSYDDVGDRLWTGRRDTLFALDLRSGRADTLTAADGLPRGPYAFSRFARLADGRRVLVVGVPGGIAVADAAAPRPRFVVHDTTSLPALPGGGITSAAVLADGRFVVSGSEGVAAFRFGRDLRARPAVLGSYDADDGLADPKVDRATPAIATGDVWLATAGGLARLTLPDSTPDGDAPGLLDVLVRAGPEGETLRDGGTLRAGRASLAVLASFENDEHETGTRFAVTLRGGAVTDTARAWSVLGERRFEALADGDYVLEVRARDRLGRVSAPRVLRFTVLPPPWRAAPMLALYGLAIAGATGGVVALRTRRLRDRTRDAEQAAARIRASEERFRLLFDRGIDAQLLVEHGHVIGANPAALALFGEPRTDLLLGRAIGAILEEREGNDADVGTGTVLAVDGTRIPVTLRRTEIPLDTGTVVHLELRDRREAERLAAEREELEQQLRASQRLESLGTLAGGVAHDFNNLLTVIRMNGELADASVGDGDAAGAHEALEAVLAASDRARDIVRQILTFSRRAPATRHPLHLGALVLEARALLRSTLPTAVQLEVSDTSGADGWIAGEATQLQQLLLNLASNAEYAMRRAGGTLRIAVDAVRLDARAPRGHRTLPPGDYVRLTVADTGHGMPEATLARIFEPFYTTKPVGEGTGLGLAVLHGIVESHAGGVHVESAPARGTRFEIVFPRIAAPASVPSADVPDGDPATAVPREVRAGQTVLVVDDEPGVLAAAERALAATGLRVRTAASGEEAIAVLESLDGAVDCLVTDQSMPGMQGDALAEQVARRWAQVPVVICTGFAARIPGDVLRRGRIAALLEKPYRREQFVAVVTGAIDGRSADAPRR